MTSGPIGPDQCPPQVRCYFVDEAGDPNLFNRRGKVIVGADGCSRFFKIGFLEVADPKALTRELEELRATLLADPYFRDVPSMKPEGKKTVVAFHAKDDLAEVRWKVFDLLRRHDLKFFAIVRDKARVVEDVKETNRWDRSYRYSPNLLYDDLVGRLFRDKLHKGDEIHIHFAVRGSRPRTDAFADALERARRNFSRKWGDKGAPLTRIVPSVPARFAGLQAADYFLWALQRFYERGEDRFLKLMWPQFRLVMDLDDKRENQYGAWYTQKKPLTRAALERRWGI